MVTLLPMGDRGSWGFVAGTRHLPWGGHWLARDESRERSAPACPGHPGSRSQALASVIELIRDETLLISAGASFRAKM
jgi:hypothetical protein